MSTESKEETALRAPGSENASDLVREAFDEARELARLEVALAKNEALEELEALRASGIAFGIAATVGVLGLALVLVAVVLSLGGPIALLVVGGALVAAAALAAWLGVARLPKKPFAETRRRLVEDVKQLKERLA